MFKYKDLRMVIISIILVVLCVFSGIHFRYDRMKLIVVLLLALSVIPTLVVRFNASVFEDGMLIYTFRGIAILPQMIEFKDLTSYKLLSKHVLELQSTKMDKRFNLLSILFYLLIDSLRNHCFYYFFKTSNISTFD